MIETLRVAELLCTRLCHDLTGPIGAVNNGAEFLSEEGFNLQGQAVELIVSSAFSAVTRLQFYRSAYGKVKEHGEANLGEKKKLAADFFTDSKITLDWPDSHTEASGVSISLKMSRLIYNLLIVASSSLIRGGTIGVRISQDDAGNKVIRITAQGAGLLWDRELEKVFAGEMILNELNPKNVQPYLTYLYVKDLQASIAHEVGVEEMVLQVVQPSGQ